MKRKFQIIFTAMTASLLTITVLAQDNPPPKTDRSNHTHDNRVRPHADQLNSATKASDVEGMTVKNYQDEKLGTVEDLAVDVESGRILQVILSTGGFLGVGDRLTAVPPGALHYDAAHKLLHLDADKEKLKHAPEFKRDKWAEYSDTEHLSAVYDYYGEEKAFKFIHKGDINDGTANTTATRNADGTWGKERVTGDRRWMIPASRLGQVQKASKFMGLPVKNRQDEKLGKVENMLVDVEGGRIIAVIISSGGFLGMGDELSAVPPTVLNFNPERDTVQLDTTKEKLSTAPHFRANQWPDFSQPLYSGGIYRAYNVEPYFPTNTTIQADNTARNQRDRNNQTLTPLDQGNDKSDLEITAQIRKRIMANKEASVNAKNVKIITDKGMVTLRGPVNSMEEKRMIGEIASNIAQAGNVNNELEVK